MQIGYASAPQKVRQRQLCSLISIFTAALVLQSCSTGDKWIYPEQRTPQPNIYTEDKYQGMPFSQGLILNEKELGHFFFDKAYYLEQAAIEARKQGKFKEASVYQHRLSAMKEKQFGSHHPDFIRVWKELITDYEKSGEKEKAENARAYLASKEHETYKWIYKWTEWDEQYQRYDHSFWKKDSTQPTETQLKRDKDTILHPVLLTWAGHDLEGRAVPLNVFRELRTCRIGRGVSPNDWEDYFGGAEYDAAKQFAAYSKGKTRNQIKKLAGPPNYRSNNLDCWQDCGPGLESWLYQFGESDIPVRLTFNRDICTYAKLLNQNEDRAYSISRSAKLHKLVIGKTLGAIEREEGNPTVVKFSGVFPQEAEYYITKSQYIKLSFQFGICISAEDWLVAH